MPVVAILNHGLPKGGAEKVSLILANYFIKKGWSVDLVVFDNLIEWKIDSSVRIFCLGRAHNWLEYISKLICYFNNENPSCIIANCWPMHTYAVISSMVSRKSVPVIAVEHFSIDGSLSSKYGYKKYLFLSSLYFTYLFADKGVAISQSLYESFRSMGIPSKKLTLIPNPMFFSDHAKYIGAVPNSVSSIENKIKPVSILMAGSLCARKDYKLALYSFHQLLSSHSDNYELIIAGQGPDRDELGKLSNALEISHKVSFKGRVDNMDQLYSSADIFLLTSLYEGLPSVLIEALSHGVTVVSVACKDGPVEILGSTYPYLVSKRDPCILASSIFRASIKPVSAEFCRKLAEPFDATARSQDYLDLALSLL
jgi:glycosyltransferase involved in cell wall biosynthesis